MNKWDLNRKIGEKVGIPANKVNEVIDAFAEIVVNECRDNGEKMAIPNLGIFKQKINKARVGVPNPLKKGETMDISESRSISFRPSSNVKQVVEKKAKKAKK